MNNVNKKILIVVSVVILGIASIVGIYRYKSGKNYENLINSANNHMKDGKYDEAIEVLQESLSYKMDESVKDKIELAKQYKEAKAIYDRGIKFVSEKKYLEAIKEFEKITKEDGKIYSEAISKIKECKKQYEALNTNNKKNTESNKQGNENSGNGVNAKITPDYACELVKKQLKGNNDKMKFNYDHDDVKNGVQYYVIQAFEDLSDHVATSGWYYVDKNTGKVYEWDLSSDLLIPLK
ncbi:tetratricopeptide (TPR) repeat protein [Clostridium tetanomorphum]|uniref:Tetratricopeptide repeat protein n=1 Tax=Clostridium tetanomorphum TaxID=1553 RepID=A0A923EAJ5_CLOTT|nr:hypothetical protein [Clostridium tetanomorphum]KAJ51156.1 hypothetical protein CTM_14758 [Clostridium tetanomorphum DSM 665]MBC2398164.1 hypothetical protein [Clostridium tetanomorphum]MBP1864415.1 tetratricopeptide (TPR) repeat protein [Clostridium tetanomorphum]NRS83054.1 tetratricopeptide (TPR) repeat protein [Clostridium tetanomorphum]NRZ98849.1 tetratricopeptide (TPR) repeat protein [Clostridium tetanomorphum]